MIRDCFVSVDPLAFGTVKSLNKLWKSSWESRLNAGRDINEVAL